MLCILIYFYSIATMYNVFCNTHMNVHICIQWNGMPAGSPYM